MNVKITELTWNASGKRQGNINGTLDWILGYLDPNNSNLNLIHELDINSIPSISICIQDNIAEDIYLRFGAVDDRLVSTLLILAYALGGQE